MVAMEVDDQDYCYNKKQGGKALPNLEHLFEGYDPTDIFQWELSIQMWARGATSLTTINKVGNKAKMLLMKLQSAHGKANFEMFNKKYKHIKLETFPQKAKEVQKFLNYETIINDRRRIMSFIVHVTGLVPFGMFKQKMFCWLHKNQVFINMTIFWLFKDMVIKIGHLTGANQKAVHRLGYQDDINDLLD
eukprot:636045-Ditylum_brightwellii.AAC.1